MKRATRTTFLLTAYGWDHENQNSFLIRKRKYYTQKGVDKARNRIMESMAKWEPIVLVQFLGWF